MSLLPLLLGALARAQDTAAAGDTTPAPESAGVDAHGFTLSALSADPRGLLTLQRPGAAAGGTFFVGGVLEYAKSPLVAETATGEVVQIVDNLVVLAASAGVQAHERVRVDVSAPLFLSTAGLEAEGGATIGDIRLASMLTLVRPTGGGGGGGLGLGVTPWLDLPTGPEDRFLGQAGIAGGALAAATYEADALTLTGNVGAQLNPSVAIGNLTGSDSLVAGLGAGWLVGDDLGLNGEVRGSLPFVGSPEAGTGAPFEGIASVRVRTDAGGHVVGGVATGLTSGVGSAALRVFVGGGFGTGGSDVASAPKDADQDGIVDKADTCPDQAETLNGVSDDDGCPERNPKLTIRVVRDGKPLVGAAVTLKGPTDHTLTSAEAPIELEVPADSMWKVEARLGACLAGDLMKQILTQDVTLDLPVSFVPGAIVSVLVKDANGDPVPGATARFTSADPHCVPASPVAFQDGGFLLQDVGPGEHTLRVEAPGYGPYETKLKLELGDEREVAATLPKK